MVQLRRNHHGKNCCDSQGDGGGGSGPGQNWCQMSGGSAKSKKHGGRCWHNHGGQQQPLYNGPIAPFLKLANHWKPKENVSALVVAKKNDLEHDDQQKL